MKRALIRGGKQRVYFWPAMPPEAPRPAYHCFDTTTGERFITPTHQQAIQWCDRAKCPLLAPLPFDQEVTT